MINSFSQRGGGVKVKKQQKGIERGTKTGNRRGGKRHGGWVYRMPLLIKQGVSFLPSSSRARRCNRRVDHPSIRRNDQEQRKQLSGRIFNLGQIRPFSNRIEHGAKDIGTPIHTQQFIPILSFEYILSCCYFRSGHFTTCSPIERFYPRENYPFPACISSRLRVMSGVGSLIVIARCLLYVFYFFLSLILEKIVLVDYASNLLFLFASLRGKITPASWLFATLPCSPVQRLPPLFRHRETKGFKTRGRGRREKRLVPSTWTKRL